MYTAHFNLREPPFAAATDPAYLYPGPLHQEALGHLLYGIGQYGGFVQLTGEPGTGKTTIVQALLRQDLGRIEVAALNGARRSEVEFVAAICDELKVPYPRPAASIKPLVDALNEHLLRTHAAGGHTILIVDEAQDLDAAVLEQVRLLTNLETDKEKLLRIVLVGQPALIGVLARRELRQLASRITTRYHLPPLSMQDTARYVVHRVGVAGGASDLFTAEALRRVHRHTRGNPRRINALCDRALLGAYARGLRAVTPDVVDQAAAETMGEEATGLAAAPWLAALRARLGRGLPLGRIEGALAVAALIVAGMVLSDRLHRHAAKPAAKAPEPPSKPAAAIAPAPAPPSAAALAAPAPPPAPAPKPAAPPPPVAAAPVGVPPAVATPSQTQAVQPAPPPVAAVATPPPAKPVIAAQELCRSAPRRGPECEESVIAWPALGLADPLAVADAPPAAAPPPAASTPAAAKAPAQAKPVRREKPATKPKPTRASQPAHAVATTPASTPAPAPAPAPTPTPAPAKAPAAGRHVPQAPVVTVPIPDAVPVPGQPLQSRQHAPIISLPAAGSPPPAAAPKPDATQPKAGGSGG